MPPLRAELDHSFDVARIDSMMLTERPTRSSRMAESDLIEGPLTRSVIGAFFEVYNSLGYGFLEHVYIMSLERELRARGHHVAREMSVWIAYKGTDVAQQRLDMVVDGKVIVETKATQELHRSAERQVYNYLRASGLQVGLLLHFGPDARFYRIVHRNGRFTQRAGKEGSL
jgi:GxxExxY protein